MATAQRLRYLLRSTTGWLNADRRKCPCCGAQDYDPVQRKLMVTALVRCRSCRLLYRIPTDPPERNFDFYQEDYSFGYTTECPNDEKLQELMKDKFRGTDRCYAERIEMLRALGVSPGRRVFEYGASWGYGSWQMQDAGYVVRGFEISRPRARYAREKLGIDVRDDLEGVEGPFDVFFSSHVLEHVPAPLTTIDFAKEVTRPEGLFVAYTPNGSLVRMQERPESYLHHWGDIHPNMLDEEFYQQAFGDRPKLMASDPYDLAAISGWDGASDVRLNLTGEELLFVCVI